MSENRRDHDWIDYTQLALSAVQVHKLGQISSEVSRLRQLEEARDEKAAAQNRLRTTVLKAEEIIDAMENDNGVERWPQNRYVGAQFTLSELRRHRILPPQEPFKETKVGRIIIPVRRVLEFETFEDKQRVIGLEKRLKSICHRALANMDEQQTSEAELCWQFMRESAGLDDLVRRVKKRGDPIKRKEAEIQKLGDKLMQIQSTENPKTGFRSLLSGFFGSKNHEQEKQEITQQIEKASKKLEEFASRAAAMGDEEADPSTPLKEAERTWA